MPSFGFVGPSYRAQSLNVDCQTTRNLYLEVVESGRGKGPAALMRTPGKRTYSTMPGMLVTRKIWFASDRVFVVAEDLASQHLFEVLEANPGAPIDRGALGAKGGPVTMTSNGATPAQLLVSSAGRVFLFNLGTNVLSEIDTSGGPALQGPVSVVDYFDGYFVALLSNSNKFQISGLFDGATWDPLDIAEVSTFPDPILSMRVDHRELWLMGQTKTTVYNDTGNPDFPFEQVQAADIEQGIAGVSPPVQLDNSIFWIGADKRGPAVAWRANGYTPTRVSNHAIENEWQRYATVADVEYYAYQENGHAFWVCYFPTANKTWVYDVATQMWHERAAYDDGADRSRCHVFAFGRHLVGDWNTAKVYDQSVRYLDDDGVEIKRLRRAPHIANELKRLRHVQLQVDCQVGVGPMPPLLDGLGNPRDPQMQLRCSDDGAQTWSNGAIRGVGQAGKFRTRVIWRRLGQARDRVYELSFSDPVDWSIIDAYLELA